MKEKFIYPTDEELANVFVDDLFSAFMTEITKYPVLPLDEINYLTLKYREGDLDAKDKLFKHNLRLVVHVASFFKNKIQHLKIMDIIQEGCIGLMIAIDKYDQTKGAFSTYATICIKQTILRAIEDTEKEIRIPVHTFHKIPKYRRILEEAKQNNHEMPSDKELKKILKCTDIGLKIIKENCNKTIISAQTKVNDEENSDLINFILDPNNRYDEFLDNLDDHELLAVLKENLEPIEYYTLYTHSVDQKAETTTLIKIAKMFDVTRQRMTQINKDAINKIKIYLTNSYARHKEVLRIEYSFNQPISKINIRPIDPNNIIMYFYIKDNLNDIEKRIYFGLLFGELNLNTLETARSFQISVKEYEKTLMKIRNTVTEKLKDREQYENYKSLMITTYKTKIFMLVEQIDEESPEYSEINQNQEKIFKQILEK